MKSFLVLLFTLAFLVFPDTVKDQETTGIRIATISFEFPSKKVKGTIGGFESTSEIDLDNLANSTFSGSVAVQTLDTNNGLRNWSLRSGKYFDADDYPKISFKSTAVELAEGEITVTGELTLKGTTKPVTITFTQNGKTLTGRTTLYSSDYGIKIKKKREDNLVKIKFVFELS